MNTPPTNLKFGAVLDKLFLSVCSGAVLILAVTIGYWALNFGNHPRAGPLYHEPDAFQRLRKSNLYGSKPVANTVYRAEQVYKRLFVCRVPKELLVDLGPYDPTNGSTSYSGPFREKQ